MKFILTALSCLALTASPALAQAAVPAPKTTTPAQKAAPVKKIPITGKIIDSTAQKPLAFATVTLLDSTKAVNATYTDALGKYKIDAPKGSYTIKFSMMGYTTKEMPVLLDIPKTMEDVVMSEGMQINAVVVTTQLVTSDIDKTTYNTAADPETPTLTALEMMRKVPMLTVDGEDNIKLKGQGNFKILVNGKSSTLMNSNYKDVLKSMPAGSIKKIEVITNPPAKYDAEGIGGIINIITDRQTTNGFNGSLNAGVNRYGSWNAGGYIAAALGKFSLSANYYASQYLSKGRGSSSERVNFFEENMRYINAHSSSESQSLNQGFNLEASYQIDTLNLLSLSVGGWFGRGSSTSTSQTDYFNSDMVRTRQYMNNVSNGYGYSDLNVGVDYQKTFKKPDQTLTASYKFEYNANPSDYSNNIEGLLDYPSYSERANSQAWSGEHTIQLDYFDPINKHHQVEVGGKYIMRPNMGSSNNERLEGDIWVDNNAAKRNDLDYLQHIGSVYAAYQYTYEKFSVKGGMRAEYTVNTGTFKYHLADQNDLFSRYFNVIPYLTFGFKPSDADNLRLGYTQRISRPGIWYLNPYVNDSDPMNKSTGNPNLDSEISHNFDFSYGRYGSTYNVNASLSASLNNNSIEQVTVQLPDGSLLTSPQNIGRSQRYNMSLSANKSFWERKINISLNANGSYSLIDANNGSGLHNQGWDWSASCWMSGQFWKDGSVNLGGYYSSPSVSLQGQSSGYFGYNVSVGQWFLKRKFRVNAYVSNPFTAYTTYNSSTITNTFEQHYRSYSQSQRFGVSVQWRFGKLQTQVKKVKRGISNDDSAGGGGNRGGGGE